MKHPVLLLLLVAGLRAQAQVSPITSLVGAGINLARGSSGSTHQQKETLFVEPVTFGSYTIGQKRTPANKLPKPDKGGAEVQAIEQLLAGRAAALQADSTVLLLSMTEEKEFNRLRTSLETFNPFWNTDPYSKELNFYRQHDDVRRRRARAGAGH